VGQLFGERGAAPLASVLRGIVGGAAIGTGVHAVRVVTSGLPPSAFPGEALSSTMRMSSLLGGYALVRCIFKEATGSDALSCMAGGAAVIVGATFSSPARVEAQRKQLAVMLRAMGNTAPVPTYFVALTCATSGSAMVGGFDFLLSRATGTRW
jgi:hypothetical protein